MCLHRGIQQQDAADPKRAKGAADLATPAPGSNAAEGGVLLHGTDTASLHAGQSSQHGLRQRYDSRQQHCPELSSCWRILELLQAWCRSLAVSECPVLCRTASGRLQTSISQPESELHGIDSASTARTPLLVGSQSRGSQLRGRLADGASFQMGLGPSLARPDALVQ